jgi:MFS family permease
VHVGIVLAIGSGGKPLVAARMLALVALGQLLGMTLWFSATAAAPALADAFDLTGGGTAWLTMAVQAGFVAGTFASAASNLADRVNARHLFAAGCAAGAAANALIPLAGSVTVVIALRLVTGAALACVYPPGLKIAAGWFLERRGTALGIVVGALTVGSAFPHLLAYAAADAPWRILMWTSSLLAVAGGVLVLTRVADGPYLAPFAPFDPRGVRRAIGNRGVRLAIGGYLGHMWELYAMWTWMPAYAAASLASAGSAPDGSGSLVAFLAIATGAAGCVIGGHWGDRRGKSRIARDAMILSGVSAAAAPAVFGLPAPFLIALAIVWGFSIVADSAQFSALVTEQAPPTLVGTALTLQICAGFLLTLVSIRLVPLAAEIVGWRWAFLVLVPGPALGAWVMTCLADPPARSGVPPRR